MLLPNSGYLSAESCFHVIQNLNHYLHLHVSMLPQGMMFFLLINTILVLTFYICQDIFLM